jgi:hypothetical protein
VAGPPAKKRSQKALERLPMIERLGISDGSKLRRPITSARGCCLAAATSPGASSGACWPSPSRVTTCSAPSRSASANPAASALPLPWLPGWPSTWAPAASACSTVRSREPSLTTIASSPSAASWATVPPMVASQPKAGTTASARPWAIGRAPCPFVLVIRER